MRRKSRGLPHFLSRRELGCGRTSDLTPQRAVRALLEDKATLPNKNLPCELSGQTRSTLLVAFSPDGTRLASTHCDHTVRITEIRTGKCSHILTGHPRTPWSIAYHPSSNDILATGCLAGEVRIWDLRGGGSEVWCTEENVSITSLAFHPVDQVLVIALANELLFWDWTQQSEPFTRCKTAHSYEKVRWVKFDPCGHRLFTGIANSATIHADEEDIGYIGEEGAFNVNPPVPRERRTFYSQQYRAIVEEISQRTRERVAPYPAANDNHAPSARFLNALSTSRPLSLSPHHMASLSDARSYAQRTSTLNLRSSASVHSLHGLLSESNPLPIPLEADPSAPQLPDPRVFPPLGIMGTTTSEQPPPVTTAAVSLSSSSSSVPRCLSFDSLLRSQLTVPGVPSTRADAGNLPVSSALSSSRSLSFRENSAIGAVTVVAGSSPSTTSTAPSAATPVAAPRSTAFFNMGPGGTTLRPQGGLLSVSSLASVSTTSTVSSRPSTGYLSTAASSSAAVAGDDALSSSSGPHGPLCPLACRICAPFERLDRNSNSLPRHSLRLREMLVVPSRVSRSTSGSPLPSNAAAASPHSRRQPHRLSSIIENEVRHTLDQVRSRRIDLSETLRNLDQLRHELAAPRVTPYVPPNPPDRYDEEIEVSDWPDSRSVNDNDDVDSMITEAGSRGSASSPASNVTGVDDSSRSSVAGDDPMDEESELDALSVGSNDSSAPPLSDEPDLGSFGVYSAELENRVNELDQRVSEIQRRLNERMRALSNERSRTSANAAWSSRLQYQQMTAQRRRDRFVRMRAHLEDIRSRYSSRPAETRRESSDVISRRERILRLRAVHQDIQNMRQEIARRRQQVRDSERAWHRLQRRNLHPHYSSSILDDAVNNEGNEGLQAAVNRVIAGAYLASGGDISVANNIGNQTHRIQQWDFSKCLIPDISNSECNIVVPHCKIHNDANCDISRDGTLLTTFVPSNRGFPDDTLLAVFSLMPDTLGQCLYTKSFGPNAISLSLSPLNNFVLVGLASRRLTCPLNPKQMVAQVYKLVKPKAGEDSTDHICDIMHPCDSDIRAPVSINSARWLPGVGEGLAYGTNRGDLHIYRPGFEQEEKRSSPVSGGASNGNPAEGVSLRRDLMQMLGLTVPHTTSTSTQTVHRVRRTASTQTDSLGQHDDH